MSLVQRCTCCFNVLHSCDATVRVDVAFGRDLASSAGIGAPIANWQQPQPLATFSRCAARCQWAHPKRGDLGPLHLNPFVSTVTVTNSQMEPT